MYLLGVQRAAVNKVIKCMYIALLGCLTGTMSLLTNVCVHSTKADSWYRRMTKPCGAKRSEQRHSFAGAAVGDRLTKSSVLPSPESAGWSRNVSRESRYGTWLRFALSDAKTPASAESDLLIDWASLRRWPWACDRSRRSEPARSTRCSFERRTVVEPCGRASTWMVKMQCEREETAFNYRIAEMETASQEALRREAERLSRIAEERSARATRLRSQTQTSATKRAQEEAEGAARLANVLVELMGTTPACLVVRGEDSLRVCLIALLVDALRRAPRDRAPTHRGR